MCYRYYVEANENIRPYLKAIQEKYGEDFLKSNSLIGDKFPKDMALVQNGSGITLMSWGYNLFDRLMHNTRIESLQQKDYYRYDYTNNKCVIIASGFYEYSNDKIRHRLTNASGILFLAGIYQHNEKSDNFSIITKAASSTKSIHSRVPLVLDYRQAMDYLAGKLSFQQLQSYEPEFIDQVNYENITLF